MNATSEGSKTTAVYRLRPDVGDAVAISSDAEQSDLSLEILRHQVSLINTNFYQLLAGTAVGSTIFVALLQFQTNLQALLIWWAAIILQAVTRVIVFLRHRNAPPAQEAQRQVAAEMMVFAAIGGGLWGIGSFLFLQADDSINLAIIAIVLCGMTSGSVAIYSAISKVYYCFALPTMLPAILGMLISGTAQAVVFGLGLLIFLIINLSYSRNLQKTIHESIGLRHQNAALVENLRDKTEQLQSMIETRTRFLATASHDLRQPLQAIGLLHSALEAKHQKSSEDLFVQLRDAHGGLSEMFNSLLDLSTLQMGSLTPDFDTVDLRSCVQDVVASVDHPPKGGPVTLASKTPRSPVWVETDALLLGRVLRNILVNALKFTPKGEVRVTLATKDGRAALSVQDTGAGIPKADLARIFDEYVQVGERSGASEGLGLGLAIVREQSKLLGVEIEVSSSVGVGTEFILSLPLTHAPQRDVAHGDSITPDQTDALNNARIIYVENDAAQSVAMTAILQAQGAEVLSARSIAQLNGELQHASQPYDLVLTDFALDGQDTAVEVLQVLRENLHKMPPVLVLSGTQIDPKLLETLPEVSDLLMKPIEAEALLQTLRDHLGR